VGTLFSRHGQLDCPVVARSVEQAISRDGFDHRPVLPEECRGVVNVGCLHFDTASLSSAVVRHLKMERVGCRLPVFVGRPAFAAHLVSPLCASNRDTLNLRFGFSCGALVAKLVQHQSVFERFAWRKNGSDSIRADQALASDQGFVLDDDANAFFKTAENFAQLQVSEPPSQCADFDRSTGLFGAEEEVFGVNTTGGPTG
jgi:hypothetical protein